MRHAICINTAPGGVIEFTADGSDAVLGKIEINAHGIIGEVDAPDGQGEKLISAGVEAAEGGRVHALAERLKHIRRQAPVLHRWSLYKSGLTYKDAAWVVIGVQDAIAQVHSVRIK